MKKILKNSSLILALVIMIMLSQVQAIPLKDYQSLEAKQKQLITWQKISEEPYVVFPETKTGFGIGFILSSLGSLSSLGKSFDHASDEMPKARQKIIHPFGVTAPIQWIPVKNRYSGIFQTGGLGLARLSIAGDPTLLGFVPGMAIKIFIDGAPSVNLQVMHSLDGQGSDENFFKTPFTNNIPKPDSLILQPLILLFSSVQNPPTYLPVDHFAKLNQKGIKSKSAVAPFALIFEPSDEVRQYYNDSFQGDDFRTRLQSIPKGTIIYNIYAQEIGSYDLEFIGSIKLKQSFVASFYQDQKLFFQHNR